MDIKEAARASLVNLKNIPTIKDSRGKLIGHAKWLLIGIASEYIEGEKAHRWLGYAQALMVLHEKASLSDMKQSNKGA